jgi:hypothetical protein
MRLDKQCVAQLSLTALLFAVILVLSLSRDFYDTSMVNPYLSLTIFSVLIVLGTLRRAWIDLAWVLAGGVLLAVFDYRLMHFQPMFMAGFSFSGLAAFGVLGSRAIWAEREERKLLLYGFVPAVLLVGSEWMATTLLDITEKLHPKTFDLFLYSFDSSLHVQISFLVGQLFSLCHPLWWTSFVFYAALPLPLALVYAAHLRRSKSTALEVMIAFLVTGPLGVLFYNMLPACGPVHLFGAAFPWHPLATGYVLRMTPVAVPVEGARNAIPSLHMTWVLLIWWNSRELPRWVRSVALAFVCFTVLATLGTGEHYFVDLVVAFPFSLMVQSLCLSHLSFRNPQRRAAFLAGILSTLAWLALLSFATGFFWISPLVPWTMVLVTVFPSVALWHRLLRANPVPEPAILRRAAAASAVS